MGNTKNADYTLSFYLKDSLPAQLASSMVN